MVKARSQIQRRLEQLQQQTATMADDFDQLHRDYLKVLAEASQQQLVLAAYHLCTQVYPDKFVALSLSQREQLQQAIRKLGAELLHQFLERLEAAQRLSRQSNQAQGISVLKQLMAAQKAASRQAHTESLDDSLDESLEGALDPSELNAELDAGENWKVDEGIAAAYDQMATEAYDETADNEDYDDLSASLDLDEALADSDAMLLDSAERLSPTEEADLMQALENLAAEQQADEIAAESPLLPIHLAKQQMLLDKSLREVLKVVSEAANQLLQQAKIVPTLPKALMNAAAETEAMAEAPAAVPNILKVSIRVMRGMDGLTADADRDSSDKPKSRSREVYEVESLPEFAVIHLRLSEVEFADPKVSLWRGKIRERIGRLKQLGVEYQKTERALATAKAEDAWRASWTSLQAD
ncbi:hypothetical protein IQ241_22765 [Romeria aff. gracilis LEGE 07310]|uniref:Uncharacterized protein n=1 Tax=Vasconcelosia minhoensis LEGE 07310 TaxID=915328 RepID=A0A8J7DEU1_9CYAN|nr:hypothetical protein [Romeria gracilis]MBE9080078.1 hypothetical protein [Romeria aff. gracilis LEGE 07310]